MLSRLLRCRFLHSRFLVQDLFSIAKFFWQNFHRRVDGSHVKRIQGVETVSVCLSLPTSPKEGWGCLMSSSRLPAYLESQGCHLTPLFFPISCFRVSFFFPSPAVPLSMLLSLFFPANGPFTWPFSQTNLSLRDRIVYVFRSFVLPSLTSSEMIAGRWYMSLWIYMTSSLLSFFSFFFF